MKRLFRWQTLVCLFIGVLVASCAMDQRFEIPGVPGGDPTPGDPGENGKSAYELWLEQLRNGDITNICTGEPWDAESDELMDFFEWLRGCNGTNGKDGADGDDGADGKDGDIPYIGPDGDWWIGDEDTDVPAQGKDGDNGADGAPGKDGDTPIIGPDGDWWIGDKDTDVPARGQQGAPGKDGTPGASAYDLWLFQLRNGAIKDCDGNNWSQTDDGMTNFVMWLKGCKGDKGEPGKTAYDIWIEYIKGGGVVENCAGVAYDETATQEQFAEWLKGCEGEKGEPGETAYEIWVGWVEAEEVYMCDGATLWPDTDAGKTEEKFREWLKGCTGADGAPGKSAYDSWTEQVGAGNVLLCDGTVVTDDSEDNFVEWLKGCKGDKGDKGEPGEDGLSAYQMWLEWVANEQVFTCDGDGKTTPWPDDKTEPTDFIDWLKGCDGANGTNGTNGKSAHDLWIEMVKAGQIYTCEGRDVSNLWRDDEISLEHFTEWLKGCTGENGGTGTPGTPGEKGQSAYEMWKDRLANNELYARCDGTVWPKAKNSENDFFEWLRGCNGEPGTDGTPGAPGEPGGVTTIVKDRYNVVTEYYQQSASEYVNAETGSVIFQVYDKESNKVDEAGWLVDMSELGVTGGPLPTDANGVITVTKDHLPTSGTIEQRHGSVKVKSLAAGAVYEASAETTYVPQKVEVRVRLSQAPVLTVANRIYVYAIVDRRVEAGAAWQRIPTYFSITRKMSVYEVSSATNPDSFDGNSKVWGSGDYHVSTTNNVSFERPIKKDPVLEENYWTKNGHNLWDDKDHYVTLALDGLLYGETPRADGIIKLAPIQRTPYVKAAQASGYQASAGGDLVLGISGTFDKDYVDYTLLFEKTFKKGAAQQDTAGDNFNLYEPVPMTKTKADAVKVFGVRFSYVPQTGGGAISAETSAAEYTTLADPTFAIDKAVYINSAMAFISGSGNTDANPSSTMFYNPQNYAHFRGLDKDHLYIDGHDDTTYTLTDIDVDYVTAP